MGRRTRAAAWFAKIDLVYNIWRAIDAELRRLVACHPTDPTRRRLLDARRAVGHRGGWRWTVTAP